MLGANKSNYIFPVTLSLNPIPNVMSGVQILGQFRLDKTMRNIAFILIGKDGKIDGISSTCITILKIDVKYISKRKSKIEDLIPNLFAEKQQFLEKQGHIIHYTPPSDVDKDYFIADEEQEPELNAKLINITFKSVDEEVKGYILKVERI